MQKIFTRIVAAISLAGIFTLTACKGGVSDLLAYDTFYYFNTQTRWAFAPKNGQSDATDAAIWNEIKAGLKDVENSVSTDLETSSVSKFNAAAAGETVEIDSTAFALLKIAQEVFNKTDGAYNPAVGLLVDLWGFSPRFTDVEPNGEKQPYDRDKFMAEISDFSRIVSELPNAEYIEKFKSLSDFSEVKLIEESGRYYAVKPDTTVVITDGEGKEYTYSMQLNLGGIGKGYAVDGGAEIIRKAGFDAGFLSVGGSSMCVFSNVENGQLTAWDVGVNNPRYGLFKTGASGEYLSVKEQNVCLSTSGDYENCYYYAESGQRYCHIINPETGYPINAEPENKKGSGIICASVFGLSAVEGDATSTALLVMGRDKAIEYVQNNLVGKDVVFVYYDGNANSYTMYTNMAAENYKLYAEIAVEKI